MDSEFVTLRHPFGEVSCENELKILQDKYKDYYFYDAPFNTDAIKNNRYLIIGRRGSGKTSLRQYFKFQKSIKKSTTIDINEKDIYDNIIYKIYEHTGNKFDISISKIVNIWEYIFWSFLFEKFRSEDKSIESACAISPNEKDPSRVARAIFKGLLSIIFKDSTNEIFAELDSYMYSKAVELAKDAVLKITSKTPIIISIDSIERYEINNIPLMRATAALVGCASNFNVAYVSKGIHVKVFLSAEIFSCLCEDFIENTGKNVQNPLYLHWKPKDLVRLISWRFYKYLNSRELIKNKKTHDIDWGNFQEVFEHMWIPYFGVCIYNSKNIKEDTFPYVLRHTQMRPRQLIKLCNSIAEISADKDEFPIFTQQAVVNGIRKVEKDLAVEVINSYSGIYPNAGKILDALAHKPVIFKANALDKYAKESSSDWPKGDYSPGKFRQLLAEMGVIGVVRRGNYETRIFEADFEYAIQDRLPIPNDEHCVIHPMFYEKLRITNDEKIIVFPFPDCTDMIIPRHPVQ